MTADQEAELSRRLAEQERNGRPHVIVDEHTIMAYGKTLAGAWEEFLSSELLAEDIYALDEDREALEVLECTDALAAQLDCDGVRNLDPRIRQLDPSEGWIRRAGKADVAWN